MPTCRVCGHDNAYGALACTNCYALLVELTDDQRSQIESTDTVYLPTNAAPALHHGSRHTPVLGADSIALYIDDRDEPVVVSIARQAILGRYTPHSSSQPRIDLTPYGAFHRGISRLHAILRRTRVGLMVEDLSSVNGSWLNHKRLQPYVPTPVCSGDHLRLGQIEIEIHFDRSVIRIQSGML